MIALAAVLDYTNAIRFTYGDEIDAWYYGGGAMSQTLSDKFRAWMLHTGHWSVEQTYIREEHSHNLERAQD